MKTKEIVKNKPRISPGVILVDGMDRSGKSSMVEYFTSKYSNVVTRHHLYKFRINPIKHYYNSVANVLWADKMANNGYLVILDRNHVSSFAYAPVVLDRYHQPIELARKVERMVTKFGILEVIALPHDLPSLVARVASDKPDDNLYHYTETQVNQIYQMFEKYAEIHDLWQSPYAMRFDGKPSDDLEETYEQIAYSAYLTRRSSLRWKASQTLAPLYSGNPEYAKRVILFTSSHHVKLSAMTKPQDNLVTAWDTAINTALTENIPGEPFPEWHNLYIDIGFDRGMIMLNDVLRDKPHLESKIWVFQKSFNRFYQMDRSLGFKYSGLNPNIIPRDEKFMAYTVEDMVTQLTR